MFREIEQRCSPKHKLLALQEMVLRGAVWTESLCHGADQLLLQEALLTVQLLRS